MEIKLDIYEVGNLMGLLMRSADHDNGDWFCQVMHKLIEACKEDGCMVITNNFEDCINIKILEHMSSTDWTLREGQKMVSGGLK